MASIPVLSIYNYAIFGASHIKTPKSFVLATFITLRRT